MYSVHKHGLMLCRVRLLCLPTSWEHLTSSTVWRQLPVSSPPPGGPGPPPPPASKMFLFSPGCAHSSFSQSVTITFNHSFIMEICIEDKYFTRTNTIQIIITQSSRDTRGRGRRQFCFGGNSLKDLDFRILLRDNISEYLSKWAARMRSLSFLFMPGALYCRELNLAISSSPVTNNNVQFISWAYCYHVKNKKISSSASAWWPFASVVLTVRFQSRD